MKKSLLLFITVSLIFPEIGAQPFSKAADDAYLVTRMVEKFHFQPRNLNDQFSADVLNKFLKALDGQRIFFTQPDITSLEFYKYRLDDEIKNRSTKFLQAVSSLYKTRLIQAQAMLDNITKSPFNFYFPVKFTVAEDTSWPANAAAQKVKIYKVISYALLNALVNNNDDIASLNIVELKKRMLKNEPSIRSNIQGAFRRSINTMLQSPGGLQKIVSDEYCKSIALCYDPHTEYLPATEKENLDTELGEKEIGLGFNLISDKNGNVFVNDLMPGSPAYKSGQINRGDKIVYIQWEGSALIDLAGATVKEITEVLNASNHGKIIISFKKADGRNKQVMLSKEKIEDDLEENKVKSFLLKGDKIIGYISLPSFYEDWENDIGINGCANDVAKEIVKLKKENIDGLLIDVRFNSGGSIQEAIELAGIFIDAGPVAQYRSAKQTITALKDANKGTIYDGPLMIMVNGYSASASEMFAAVLQDYNRALIAGSPTFGKATSQVILPLDSAVTPDSDLSKSNADNFIKITVAEIYRVTGKPLQGLGVIPDISFPDFDAQKEKDNPFVLSSKPIPVNKYYQPAKPLSFNNVKAIAKKEISSSPYFTHFQQYVEAENRSKQKKDVSLQLNDALALQNISTPRPDTAESKLFKIHNHAYDDKRLGQNKTLKEVNDAWKKNLSQDAYIRLAYILMTASTTD
jgi:carboxyl-terminal processing protease